MDPGYVLDEMKVYEVSEYLGSLQYRNKDGWDQARIITYITAQANSREKIKPSDIIKFPWDEKEPAKEITEEERQRLIKRAEEVKWLI